MTMFRLQLLLVSGIVVVVVVVVFVVVVVVVAIVVFNLPTIRLMEKPIGAWVQTRPLA